MASSKKSVLMVCLGNICRSVMAEAILRELVENLGEADQWDIDSAATAAYNIGNLPYHCTNDTLHKHGRKESGHKARLLTKSDFKRFQYIFGFDKSNMQYIKGMRPSESTAIIRILGYYDDKNPGVEVDDPYYTGDFEKCYEQCERYCQAFLQDVSGK